MGKTTNKKEREREKEIIELIKLKETDYTTFLRIESFIRGVLFVKGVSANANTYE